MVSPFIHGFQISRHSIELGYYRSFVIQFLYVYQIDLNHHFVLFVCYVVFSR